MGNEVVGIYFNEPTGVNLHELIADQQKTVDILPNESENIATFLAVEDDRTRAVRRESFRRFPQQVVAYDNVIPKQPEGREHHLLYVPPHLSYAIHIKHPPTEPIPEATLNDREALEKFA